MKLLDPAHPFFRPKWRRVALVALSFAWAGVEATMGNPVWAFLFAGIGGYLAWVLILTFREDEP